MNLYPCRRVRFFAACRLSSDGCTGAAANRERVSKLSAFAGLAQTSRTLDLEPNFGGLGGLFFAPGCSAVTAGISGPIRRPLQALARELNRADCRCEETIGNPAPDRSGIVEVCIATSR